MKENTPVKITVIIVIGLLIYTLISPVAPEVAKERIKANSYTDCLQRLVKGQHPAQELTAHTEMCTNKFYPKEDSTDVNP